MAQIDRVKETIGILKTLLGISIALIVTISAGLIGMYYKEQFDFLFYIGGVLDLLIILLTPYLVRLMIKNLKILEEL